MKRTHAIMLGIMVFSTSFLLVARFPPNIFAWSSSLSTFTEDLVLLAFPILGIWVGIEFLRKDEWGWGGLLFHVFILYTCIGYSILAIIDIVAIVQQSTMLASGLLDVALAVLGWIGLLYYYD